MRIIMQDQGIGENDAVWDWPARDTELEEAYERAMSIL